MKLGHKIQCPACGHPTYPDGKFCGHCGVRLLQVQPEGAAGDVTHASLVASGAATVCPNCQEPLLPHERFCVACGVSRVAAPGAAPAMSTTPGAWDRVLARLRTATAGEYEILAELGRGGMAAVYLAYEPALRRQVAIKVMSPGLLLDAGMVERFKREATTVAGLRHPNIVTIYSVREGEDLHYFVMEYIQGLSLDRLLKAHGALPVPAVRAVLSQMASALHYAHRRGVVHRDIKPGNVMINRDGDAIVTDFGIAKVPAADSHTATGTSIGTPAYMSPEQCAGQPLTGASDQYSLGVVAYEMLAGTVPFQGPPYLVQTAHVQQDPPALASRRPDCPRDLARAVMRMLAKRPEDRWPTAVDAANAGGAVPLPEGDPVRLQVAELVASVAEPATDEPRLSTPVSPMMVRQDESRGATPGAGVPPSAVRSRPFRSRMPEPRILGFAGGGLVALVAIAWIAARAFGGGSTGADTDPVDPGPPPPAPGVPPAPPPVRLDIRGPASAVTGDTVVFEVANPDRPGERVLARCESSAPAVLQVDPSCGRALALAGGDALVTAFDQTGTSTAQWAVRIDPPTLANLVIAGAPDSLRVGARVTLAARGRDQRGRPMSVPVEWSSSDPARASVDARGVVVARQPGAVVVRARSGTETVAATIRITSGVIVQTDTARPSPPGPPPPAPPPPAPPPPPPAPGPPDPDTEARTAAAIRQTLDGYVALLRDRRAAEVAAVYDPASDADRRNLRNLENLLRTADYAAQVLATEFEPPRISGARAEASFRVRMGWKTAFGPVRQEWVPFRAELVRQGGNAWRIERCRIVGTPRIG